MNVIVGGRASGKTYRLVEWYKKDPTNRRIITRDYSTARDLNRNYGVDMRHVFYLQDRDQIRGHNGQFGLDFDVEKLFLGTLGLDGIHQTLGPVTINGAAMDASTGEVVTRPRAVPNLETVSPRMRAEATGEWIE